MSSKFPFSVHRLSRGPGVPSRFHAGRHAPSLPAGSSQAAIGVVRGRAELETAKEGESLREGQTGERLVPREGAAQPSEYVTIVIHGPMRIKVSAEGGLYPTEDMLRCH